MKVWCNRTTIIFIQRTLLFKECLRNQALVHTRHFPFCLSPVSGTKYLRKRTFLCWNKVSHSSHWSQTHYELSLSPNSQSFGLGLPNARFTDVGCHAQLGESTERKKMLLLLITLEFASVVSWLHRHRLEASLDATVGSAWHFPDRTWSFVKEISKCSCEATSSEPSNLQCKCRLPVQPEALISHSNHGQTKITNIWAKSLMGMEEIKTTLTRAKKMLVTVFNLLGGLISQVQCWNKNGKI